ncbi:MAG: hypothetical protein M1827_004211 [Pycnora praestabilis]|nr:MAG: hypothetical protein M1827_004211 [Pycnora praestabilis]
MDDMDAELLALAGGDTSDEEDTKLPNKTVKSESPSTPRSPAEKGNRDTSTKQGVSQKRSTKATGTSKKAIKRGKREDSEEEGEASSAPSSPISLQSASMSESDSDTSPADGGDNSPVFPLENKYYSEKDRAEIMAMSEIQREELLAERAAIVERRFQDLQLRRLLQNREREGAKAADKKKRKAGAADLDDGQRKSSRQKTTLGGRKVGEKSGALEDYKRQREQRGIENKQRRRDEEEGRGKDRKGRDAEDGYSDADADGESEVEWDDGKPKAGAGRTSLSAARDEQPADIKDFERVRVGRTNFAKVCFYPGFEKAIVDCFARVSIGPDKATGQNIYRMAQIKGFMEGKPYAMESLNGKHFITNQYALVALGKSEKEWPLLACSDSRFTEAEFERYKRTMAVESLPTPTKPFLNTKIQDINKLIEHRFTDQEIQEKLKRSGALQNRFASIERNSILNRRKEAVAKGDEAAIARFDAELAKFDGPKLAFGTSLSNSPTKPSKGPNEQDRLAILNRANRKANAEDIRRAQIAEKRAEAKAQAAVARGEATLNPFQRVKTRAKVHYDVHNDSLAPPTSSHGVDDLFEGSDRSRAGTPLSIGGTNTPKKIGSPRRSGTPVPVGKTANGEKKGGIPTIRKRNMDDETIAAMDLGIEIEI